MEASEIHPLVTPSRHGAQGKGPPCPSLSYAAGQRYKRISNMIGIKSKLKQRSLDCLVKKSNAVARSLSKWSAVREPSPKRPCASGSRDGF